MKQAREAASQRFLAENDCNLQNGMKSTIKKRKALSKNELLAAAIDDPFRLYNTCGSYWGTKIPQLNLSFEILIKCMKSIK